MKTFLGGRVYLRTTGKHIVLQNLLLSVGEILNF